MAAKKYVLDDGHGMTTSGKRTDIFTDGTKSSETNKNYMHENEFNRAVVKYLGMHLKASGFAVYYSAPTDADTPLNDRAAYSNRIGADGFVSVHANALTGSFKTNKAHGIETFVYMGGSGKSERLGRAIHSELVKGTKLADRGVKKGNHLAMIRLPAAYAVLVECGFMDNLREAKLLLTDSYRKECAEEIARGICVFEKTTFVNGIDKATISKPVQSLPWFRVRETWEKIDSQEGAFVDLESAKEVANKLGLSVFDETGKMIHKGTAEKKETLYRVRKTWGDAGSQKGAFYNLDAAKEVADTFAYTAFDEAGKSVYVGKKPTAVTPVVKPILTPLPKPTVDPHADHSGIFGKQVATEEQMAQFLLRANPNFDDAREVAKAFLKVGAQYGIRGDIAFCQSLIETGWFRFDGGTAVTPDQYNYCGLGVTQKGIKGAAFDSIEDGVTAQIQHLFAYATKDELPKGTKVVDPRFGLVNRGSAPHWEDLSMKWAMNADYGKHILQIFKDLGRFVPVEDKIQQALNSIPTYGQEFVRRLLEEKITDGSRPEDAATRLEAMIIIGRLFVHMETEFMDQVKKYVDTAIAESKK